MTLGFVLGKFYPPHRGHRHLIETARRGCDRLVVLLPHHDSQRIPGELRQAWLREIHPDCEIHLVPDEVEDGPELWAQFTIQHLGRAPDVVFSSEDYGPPFAAALGCRHVMVDRDRVAFPVSGTAVRSSPLEHLRWLEPCVRAYFVRRVVLIGAESTGKTTLARALARHYETVWVPEFGREYWEGKVTQGLPAGQPPTWPAGDGVESAAAPSAESTEAPSVEDVETRAVEASTGAPTAELASDEFRVIAAEQQRREDAAARVANRVLICDTNAFVTGTWHERYRGHRDAAVDAIGARDRVHLYLLTEPDFPFVQDGWRDGEHVRDGMHARFQAQLAALPTPVVRLRGSPDARMATAVAAIDALLAEPFDL
ncbi:AAA family ATPase [Longimicrobium sp.]|uniref:AAA family ATPase n=1 Tax=Longimicrobium sp. TaxID=2029185 RepID=UPI002E3759F6|nr:AAA family ATPase [Longimicrobium sp.]HEX6042108.1 AAA family ATPase [Longimicrobium sp.]